MFSTLQIFIFNPGQHYENLLCRYKSEESQQQEKSIAISHDTERYSSFLLYPVKFPVCILAIENESFKDDNNGQGYYCSLAGTYLLGCGNLVYLWPTCETLPNLENTLAQNYKLSNHTENELKTIVQLCKHKLAVSSIDTPDWLNVASFLLERLSDLYSAFFVSRTEEDVYPPSECSSAERRQILRELVEVVGRTWRFCLSKMVMDVAIVLETWVQCERFGSLGENISPTYWSNTTNSNFTLQEDFVSNHYELPNRLILLCCLLSCELVDWESTHFPDKVSSLLPILFMGSLPLFPHQLRLSCLEQLSKVSKLPHWVANLDEKMKRDFLISLSITLNNFRDVPDEMQILLIETLYRLGCYSSLRNFFETLCVSKLLRSIAFYAKQKSNASLAACASVVCEFVLNHYEDSFGFLVDSNMLQDKDDLLTTSSYHRALQVLCQQQFSKVNGFHGKFLEATQEQRKSLGVQNVIHCVPTERKASLDIWEPLTRDSRKWNSWLQNRTKMVRKLVMYGIPMQIRALVWRKLLKTDQLMQKYKGVFDKLLKANRPKEVDDMIERDIVRTLPSHHIFWSFGAAPGIDSLRSILLAYAALVPQVGYCQGMSSIAAMILLFSCDVEEAFLNFVYMMDTVGLHDLFYPGFAILKTRVAEFHGIALFYFPQLMKHLAVEGIHPMMFVDKWFLTACIYNFPFPLVVRLWDIMLTYSHTKIIMRAGLAILGIGKDRMMQMQFEELVQFVQKGFADPTEGVVGDVDYFIEKAMSFRFKRKRATALARHSDIMEQVDMHQKTVLGCFPSSTQNNTKYSQTRPLEMLDKWVTSS